ncbi:hypothetical protein [Nocardioides sp.]|uniref:hypothetical protein n=1 Tax=Nocardioides sp. TaxID=35761 RepID=UPI00351226ED
MTNTDHDGALHALDTTYLIDALADFGKGRRNLGIALTRSRDALATEGDHKLAAVYNALACLTFDVDKHERDLIARLADPEATGGLILDDEPDADQDSDQGDDGA